LEDRDQPRKQRHMARRIHNHLMEEHVYKGSKSTMRRYVRFAKLALGLEESGAYIPCDLEAGIEPSVGSVGDSYDNALAESVIGLSVTKGDRSSS